MHTAATGWQGGPAHGPAKIVLDNSDTAAMVVQKPCVQRPKCITQRDANIGAPSTEAPVLKEISLGLPFFPSVVVEVAVAPPAHAERCIQIHPQECATNLAERASSK
jgi:hypothetical protein